jgi:hypothetical protein
VVDILLVGDATDISTHESSVLKREPNASLLHAIINTVVAQIVINLFILFTPLFQLAPLLSCEGKKGAGS